MVSAVGGVLDRRCARAERVGEDVCPSNQVANGATKKTKREGSGASDFIGFCRMGRCNNQPKSGRIVGVYMREAARRAMTVGEDAIESF